MTSAISYSRAAPNSAGQMAEADRQAIRLAGGPDVPISITPAAAAPDNNHQRAGRNGVDWFAILDLCIIVSSSDHHQSRGVEDNPKKGPGPPLLVAADLYIHPGG